MSRAGTETQLLALIRALDRRRVRPSLALLDGTSETSRALEPADCPVLRLGLPRLASRRAPDAALRLRRFWREHRADVVQVYFLDSAYFGVPVARWAGVRSVVRVRNNLGYWLTPKHRLLNRVVGRLAHRTLTNSDAGRDALIASERLNPDKVAVVTNGVDLARFDGLPAPGAGPGLTVGCVANLRPVKNIDGLMRAAAMLLPKFPGLRFRVAGGGESREALGSLHAELGLGDRFELCGSVADVPGFLGTVDVGVLPSHSEGMSNALLELMAAGRGAVATDVGASRAVLGDAGVIVPPGDDAALAAALAELAADPARARTLGDAGRRRAEAEYGRAAMVRRFEAFWRGTLR